MLIAVGMACRLLVVAWSIYQKVKYPIERSNLDSLTESGRLPAI
jgi:hypothetical protein